MPSTRTTWQCTACGQQSARWVGRCTGCGAWDALEERGAAPEPTAPTLATPPRVPATVLADVSAQAATRLATGLDEFDRVLAGGLVPGSVTLLGGEPGAGKSTLLLQAAAALAEDGHGVLYVSAEESAEQVRLRAERLGLLGSGLLFAAEADLPAILGLVAHHAPRVLVVDSIQTVSNPAVAGTAGGLAQVREGAAALTTMAKQRGVAVVLVGHVTKEGTLAGPRVLEHLVDTVCDLEGDRHHALRLLRATKHRYGAVGEVGCFELGDRGMASVVDAGRLFVGASHGASGVALTLTLEGARVLACEVQALTVASAGGHPGRVASGLDAARVGLLVAVLQERCALGALRSADVYASSVGGLRLSEPAVDLALALAIASASTGRALPAGLVALGEVGLAGDLRVVAHTERRLAEAARLGFTRVLIPASYDGPGHGVETVAVRTLGEALDAAGLRGQPA